MKAASGGLLSVTRKKVIITAVLLSLAIVNTLIVLNEFQLLSKVRSDYVPPYTPLKSLPLHGKVFDTIRGIPKVIHHSWKTEKVPEIFTRWQQRWKTLHPDWDYHLWTDEDNRELVKQRFPFFLAAYDSFSLGVMRADAVRYMYMYVYGGLYTDLDMDPLQSTTDMIKNLNLRTDKPVAVLGYMGDDYEFAHNVPNAWMFSTPGHPFWMFCIMKMIEMNTLGKNGAETLTGPVMVFKALQEYNEAQKRITGISIPGPEKGTTELFDVTILKPGMIYPIDWHQPKKIPEVCLGIRSLASVDDNDCRNSFPEAFTITYWTHSW